MSSVQYKGQRYQIPPSHHGLKSLSSIRKAACKKFSLNDSQNWTLSRPGKGIISNLSQTMKDAGIPRNTHFKLVPSSNANANSAQASLASHESSVAAAASTSNVNDNSMASMASVAAQKKANEKAKHSGSIAQLRQQQSSSSSSKGNWNINNNKDNSDVLSNKHESGHIKWTLMVQVMTTGQHARHKITVSSNVNLWNMLKMIENNKENRVNLTNRQVNESDKQGYLLPIITFLNKTYSGQEEMENVKLYTIDGLNNMSLLRLSFKFIDSNSNNKNDENKQESKENQSENKNNSNEDDIELESKREITKMVFDGRHAKLIIQETYKLDKSQYDMSDDFYEINETDFDIILKGIRASARPKIPRNNNNNNNNNSSNDNSNNQISGRNYVSSSKRISDYNVTCIRVRLPQTISSIDNDNDNDNNNNNNNNNNGTCKEFLQGYFKTDETVGDVRRFVLEMMTKESLHSRIDFLLYISPPKQMLNDDYVTLKSIGLVPAAIINLKLRFENQINLFKFDKNKLTIEKIERKKKLNQNDNDNDNKQNNKQNNEENDIEMGKGQSQTDNSQKNDCVESIDEK